MSRPIIKVYALSDSEPNPLEGATSFKGPLGRSLQIAFNAHHGQTRLDGSPYLVHPIAVMVMLYDLGCRGDILDVAILHDVCEVRSAPWSKAARILRGLEMEFGHRVSAMVDALSKRPKRFFLSYENSNQVRLEQYLERMRLKGDLFPQIFLVKMADQIDNLKTVSRFPLKKFRRQIDEMESSYLPLYEERLLNFPLGFKPVYQKLLKRFKDSLDREKAVLVERENSEA